MINPGADPSFVPPAGMPAPVAGQVAGLGGVDPEVAAILAGSLEETEDGGAVITLGGDITGVGSDPAAHEENMAETLPEQVLSAIAVSLLEGVEADIESNAEVYAAIKTGIALLGLKLERLSEPFDGASGAVHPMLLEAVVRFVSIAAGEMMPAAGPVRSQIIGDVTPELEARAERKKDWLNYYLTAVDEGYYPDVDQSLVYLAVMGSIFRVIFRDPLTGQPRSRFLTPLNCVVSASANSLADADRTTVIEEVSQQTMLRRMVKGFYRQTPVGSPEGETSEGKALADKSDGRTPSSRPEDAPHIVYSVHCMLDLRLHSGGEDAWLAQAAGEEGLPDGLAAPYIVDIDRDSQRVVRMIRNWEPADTLLLPREHIAHYLFHPGLGFYGWGLSTLMAASTDTASVLLRQALNAFTLHSFPGGVRVKGARPESSTLKVGPGEWPEVDTGGQKIQDSFMPMPYRDVPTSFGPLLESVVSQGKLLGQTTQMQVGEGRQDAPVGTTLALIEQAIRPTTAVMKRLHFAQRKELRLLAKLFAQSDDAKYPYVVNGRKGQALAVDFVDTTDLLPVSDPNIPTQTQRLSVAQGKLQLAQASGGMMDMRVALEGMLRAMATPEGEIKSLMKEAQPGQPADVVTEFAMALQGRPLAIAPAQSHQAHIASHLGQMQLPNLPPPVMQALMGHVAEHLAALYAIEASAAAGMPIIPGQPMPPEIEQAVAIAVGQASDAIIAKIAPILGGAGADPQKAAELAYKREELDFKRTDSQRKGQETARQDATELLRARAEVAEAAKDRALREHELAVEALTAGLAHEAAMSKDRNATVREIAKAAGQVRGAKAPSKRDGKAA